MKVPLRMAPGVTTKDFCLQVLDADGKAVLVTTLVREVNQARLGHWGCDICLTLMKQLNEITGRKFRGSDRTAAMLHARHETYGYETVSKTIAHRWTRVVGTQFEWTMRPETLFNATKFDGYQAMAQTARQERKEDDGWLRKGRG